MSSSPGKALTAVTTMVLFTPNIRPPQARRTPPTRLQNTFHTREASVRSDLAHAPARQASRQPCPAAAECSEPTAWQLPSTPTWKCLVSPRPYCPRRIVACFWASPAGHGPSADLVVPAPVKLWTLSVLRLVFSRSRTKHQVCPLLCARSSLRSTMHWP
ncbi:hypothetical protein PHLGIDRAFT_321186 [Phlebiopsis gigantea 11061_1 CR5-6]|uniref:Uncharacterized protein n=1 Tax=Phlebiopsis gigantea (strain 11061_1 CR5-6) TaxID=745531 RepID=A0A0C3RQA8_PHLG1|nr:hypothetical protein PHLGIDRAFT_321186 [Phlebiopsis gigantea 11061_1 CR5-6]